MIGRIGFCRTCERQTSEDALVCPHCGQEAPFDRFEDLELGRIYQADYKGAAGGDIHWFKLRASGRRVFAKVSQAQREACTSEVEHWLELASFDGGFPNFRYKQTN